MAKSQLKQNQLYLIKLKIVKVVTNLEIIQPQFLIGQHFLVFDKRKFKKKAKSETHFPPQTWKWRFKGHVDFWFLPCGDIHTLIGFFTWKFHYLREPFAAPHYTNPNLSQIWHLLIWFLWSEKGNAEFCLPEARVHLKVERNRGLTFITAFRISTQRTRTHSYFMVLWMWIPEWVV